MNKEKDWENVTRTRMEPHLMLIRCLKELLQRKTPPGSEVVEHTEQKY